MIALQNEPSHKDDPPSSLSTPPQEENNLPANQVKKFNSSNPLVLPSRFMSHHPKAGLNMLVDAAAYLFSVIGKLKQIKSYRHLNKLQKELIQEINIFQESMANRHYSSEYILISRYMLCATIDDVITNTAWGGQGQWDSYNLLAAFNQDNHHQNKFFTILERIVKEPAHYIDLMELAYICLSLGYKGQYRATEHNQYQLEQITYQLYKHIRAYRGSFSKSLSPFPIKTHVVTKEATNKNSPLFILFVTACIILIIFISLGYLLDVISNEAYKNLAQIGQSLSYEIS